MSKNKTKEKPFQDIFTPAIMVDELLNYIPLKSGMKVLEPSVGDGNMVEQILKAVDGIDITAIEIQEYHVEKMVHRFQDIKNVNIKKFKPLIDVFESFEFG